MQLVLDLLDFDFWLVYPKKTVNLTENYSCLLDYKRDSESEDLTIGRTLVCQGIYSTLLQ